MASLPTALQYRLLINSVLLTMPAALGHLARRPTPSTYSVARAISHLPHRRAHKDIAALQPVEWRGAAQQAALKKALNTNCSRDAPMVLDEMAIPFVDSQ